jgi:hypothetical protein
MLFSSSVLLAGGATLLVAGLDKMAEGYGFYWIGTTLKLLLTILGLVLAVYFIETNVLLHWLGL